MASVNITTNYNGEVADTLIHLTKLGNQTVEKGTVYIQAGVQDKLAMPRFNASLNQLTDRVETPVTASDSYTYDERTLEPLAMMWYDTVNPTHFMDVWEKFQPNGGGMVDFQDNPVITSAIMEETMKSIGGQVSNIMWMGDVAAGGGSPLRFFDGFVKILTNDGGIIPNPKGAITVANVLTIMGDCVAAIPDSVYSDPNLIINMGTGAYRMYEQASRNLDFKGAQITENGESRFAGFEVRHYSGLANDNIVIAKCTAGKDSNFWGGIAVDGDAENVKIARYRPESELFIVKALFQYAVQVGNPTECVIYLPA